MQQIIGFKDRVGYVWLSVQDGVVVKAQSEQGNTVPVTLEHVLAASAYINAAAVAGGAR